MNKEMLKQMFKELLESGEIQIEIYADSMPYVSDGVTLDISVDGESVSKSYIVLEDKNFDY